VSNGLRVAVMGATGAVGAEILALLDQRAFPLKDLTLLASPRSAGTTLTFKGEQLPVQMLGANSFDGIDLVLASAGGSVSL
jgi:aspartate-semialdehyde dehydrogenase